MPKLHELLAVEGSLKNQAESARTDLEDTFQKKKHHFGKRLVVFNPIGENAVPVTEEALDMQTTVKQELQWISDFIAKAINVGHVISEANTHARAEVVLDGQVFLPPLPATTLLELEKHITKLRDFVMKIPTLDPAKGFRPAPDQGDGIFVAREDVRTRTKKVQRPIVLYDATPQHPAQTQLISEDIPVGSIVTHEWSGMITTAEKGRMIERAEDLLRAVKTARAKANETDVPMTSNIGGKILQYVFGQ